MLSLRLKAMCVWLLIHIGSWSCCWALNGAGGQRQLVAVKGAGNLRQVQKLKEPRRQRLFSNSPKRFRSSQPLACMQVLQPELSVPVVQLSDARQIPVRLPPASLYPPCFWWQVASSFGFGLRPVF